MILKHYNDILYKISGMEASMGLLLVIALASIVFCWYYLNEAFRKDGSGKRSTELVRKATRVTTENARFKGVEVYLNKNE